MELITSVPSGTEFVTMKSFNTIYIYPRNIADNTVYCQLVEKNSIFVDILQKFLHTTFTLEQQYRILRKHAEKNVLVVNDIVLLNLNV